MICQRCGKRESKTPKYKYCNSCSIYFHRKRHPDYSKRYLFGGNFIKVLERDKFTCQECGFKDDNYFESNGRVLLEIHHLDGKGSQLPKKCQNNDLNNLVVLCRKCHTHCHRKKPKESGHRGVYLFRGKQWRVKIYNKKQIHIGLFDDKEDAIRAHEEAIKCLTVDK